MFNYQGVDADVVSSAIDRYATTTEHQDNMASDHGTLDTMSFTQPLYSQATAGISETNARRSPYPQSRGTSTELLKILIGRFHYGKKYWQLTALRSFR